ncbi:hypothetical protein I4U23_016409 [Adineta vaga]|nr:hypothetical protein I4U23_016409 [Adineta vaga]
MPKSMLSSSAYYCHTSSSRSRRSTVFDLRANILLEIISYLTLIDLSKLNCHLPYIRSIIQDFRLKLHGGQLNNMKHLREISSLSYRNQILLFDIPFKIIYHINPEQFLFLRSLTIRQLENYEPLSQLTREFRVERLVLTAFQPSRHFILQQHSLHQVFIRFSYLKQMEILSKTGILSAVLNTTTPSSLQI